jgi:hypothetical protein
VNRTRAELDAAAKDIVDLAKAHLKLVEKPKETQEKWQEALVRLDNCRKRLAAIRDTYGLPPEQMEFLAREEKKPAEDEKAPKGKAPSVKEKAKDGKAPAKPGDADGKPVDKKSAPKKG